MGIDRNNAAMLVVTATKHALDKSALTGYWPIFGAADDSLQPLVHSRQGVQRCARSFHLLLGVCCDTFRSLRNRAGWWCRRCRRPAHNVLRLLIKIVVPLLAD